MPPRARTAAVPWDQAEPAPLVLVTGGEALLAERAVTRVVERAREQDPSLDVIRLESAGYEAGRLRVATSPSLFDEPRLVVVEALEQATDALLADLSAYLAEPSSDVVLVVRHSGAPRGRKVADAVKAAGALVVAADAVKRDADKSAFVTDEIRRAGRRIDAGGVRALVEACGSDLRELAAACAQLVTDTTGPITADVVARYHGGRVEATGFRVADAAVEGRTGEAVALLRHALATGVDPVPLVAAVAAKLRTLVKVGAARGSGLDPVRDLGLAQWQVDRARRELARWTPEGLATAIAAVAQADAEVKGAGRDPVYAVERAVLTVAQAAGAR